MLADYRSSAPALRTPGQLAWAHCWRTVRNGFLYLPGLLVLAVAGTFVWAKGGRIPASYNWPEVARMSPWYLLALLVPAAVLLGGPAVGGALLRVPAMRWLFAWCRRTPRLALAGALLGTAALFGALVLLSAAAPLAVAHSARLSYWRTAGFFALCSLPWLLGTLAATWSLRHELRAGPPAQPAPNQAGPG